MGISFFSLQNESCRSFACCDGGPVFLHVVQFPDDYPLKLLAVYPSGA